MTMRDDADRVSSGAEWASEWLDSSARPEPHGDLASQDEATRREAADHFVLDALLDHLSANDGAEIDRRMDQLIPRLPQPAESTEAEQAQAEVMTSVGVRRQRWFASGMSLALGLAGVMTIGFLFSQATAPTAEAAVHRARQAADQQVDRHYRVQLDLPALPDLSANLYLRGGDNVALHVRGPLDFSVWLGSSRSKAWVVPSVGPALVAREIEPIQSRLEQLAGLPLPMLKIANVLQALEADYQLHLRADQTLSNRPGGPCRHVLALKREGFRPLLPQRVECWVDPETGVVVRLVLSWTQQVEELAVRQIEFNLVDQDAQPDNWYQATAHHETGRPTLELNAVPASTNH